MLKSLVLFYSLLFSVTIFAGLPSVHESQEASMAYIEKRDQRWPGYRTDQELSDFMSKSPSRYSALTRAAATGNVVAFMSIWSKLDDRLRRFYATDYDFTTGKTPLHFAAGVTKKAREGRKESSVIVKALCRYVDEQNIKNYEGDTPLMSALGIDQGNFLIAKALIENCDAQINTSNIFGLTPLMSAALHGNVEVFKYFISLGADDWALDAKGKNVFYYYNLGRINDLFVEEEGREIFDWLESHGHDFYKEALSRCLGFSARGQVRTDEMRFYTLEEDFQLGKESFTFKISENKLMSSIESEEEKLIAQCEKTGYRSCIPVRLEKFLEEEEYVANERAKISNQDGYIIYGYRRFIVGVMGSASGKESECAE